MLKDSVLYVSRVLAHLASILLMLLPLPNILVDPHEPDLLPEKIEITNPLSLRKSRICFMLELSNLHLHFLIVHLTISCQNTDKILRRNRFVLMSGSEMFSLLMKQSTLSRFALIIQSFSCSLCDQLNSFLRSKNCLVNPESTYWDTAIAKDLPRSGTVSDGDCEHFA